MDNAGPTIVVTTATGSTITDQVGNTTKLFFAKYKLKSKKIELVINKITQNDTVVSTSTTALTFKWNVSNKGGTTTYNLIASYTKTGTSSTETHYRQKKNVTVVMTKPIDLNDSENDDDGDARPIKTTLPGMMVVGLKTEKGSVKINIQ